jgi:hypothetical protein
VEEGNRVRIACDWLLDGVLPRHAVQLGLVRAAAVPLGIARPNARQGPIPSRLLEVGGSPSVLAGLRNRGGAAMAPGRHDEEARDREASARRPGWTAAETGLLNERNSTDVTRRQNMNPHVSGTTLGVGLDQRPGGKGTRVAGKFGLDPHRLDDEALERELRYLYATREETFFPGTRQALLNHTDRMLQLEHEYASRFPERTRANALQTRKGSRLGAGQPAGRQTVAER